MTKKYPSKNIDGINMNNDVNAKVTYHNNVDQSLITITEDKVEIILRDHLKQVESKESWKTPLGIFASLLVIPITTEQFKNAFSISAQSWRVLVYAGIIVSFVWLVRCVFNFYKNRKISIDCIIRAMKKIDIEQHKASEVAKNKLSRED
ncbi:hypothetical protein KA005_00270 [bacterium]|nr:hypothetical protein [bacterium]